MGVCVCVSKQSQVKQNKTENLGQIQEHLTPLISTLFAALRVCMCVCVYACMCIHVKKNYTHTCWAVFLYLVKNDRFFGSKNNRKVRPCVCACMYNICIHMYMYILCGPTCVLYMCVYIYAYMYINVYIYIYICIYVYIYTYIHMCVYTHTHVKCGPECVHFCQKESFLWISDNCNSLHRTQLQLTTSHCNILQHTATYI